MENVHEFKTGYKKTKLGWIPNDWEVRKLFELVESNRKIRYGIVQPGTFDPNGRYLIRGQDYSKGWAHPDSLFKVSDEIEARYKNARVKDGDLLITIVGAGTGTIAVVPPWLNEANITQTTARIAINKEIADNRFYFQVLSSAYGKKLTYKNIKGGAQPGLNCGDIKKYTLVFPPLREQQKIASVLSDWDSVIKEYQYLIEKLKLRKKGLMQQLLTGCNRLPEYREQWNVVSFKELFQPKTERAGSAKFEVLSVTKEGIVSQAEYFKKEVASKDTSSYKVVHKGDLAMSGLNFWMGSVDILQDFEVGIVSPAYKVFKVNKRVSSPEFMKYFVRSKLFIRALIGSSVQGASIVRRNMDKEMLENWTFKLPDINEQFAIVKVLLKADEELEKYQTYLKHLKIQKQGLLQQLLTGKIRIKK